MSTLESSWTRVATLYLCFALGGYYSALPIQSQQVPELRDSVSEWVAIERAISRESAAWQEKRVLLTDLMALAQAEIKSLEEALQQAAATASAADEKRALLVAEEKDLQRASDQVRAFMVAMEPRVSMLRKQLPLPLKSSLDEAFRRFAAATSSEEGRLGERMQALVQILDGVQKFDQNITLSEDVWELSDGTTGLVRIVYVGLGAAYYLGKADADAGIGRPGKEGWIWDSRPDLRGRVQEVVESLENKGIEAEFVPLPFSVQSKRP